MYKCINKLFVLIYNEKKYESLTIKKTEFHLN